jgi:alpha-ketoglutaric semialdehyde dehydrogenase
VKAHPAHPGTSDMVGRAIAAAATRTGVPAGVFGMVQGASTEVGMTLVQHPLVKAVGFTGSLRGGRALFDAVCRRAELIPVYAEMGSSNPVFILPGALAERGEVIAKGLVASVTLGAGQFCTNPGLTVVERSAAADEFAKTTGALLAAAPSGTTVHAGIKSAYDQGLSARAQLRGVSLAARAEGRGGSPTTEVAPALLVAEAATYAAEPALREELFGPATVLVRGASKAEVLDVARSLEGHLTATVHGTTADLAEYAELLLILRRKVGRIVVNGYPTGVEVPHAMQHGGPYPATTDSRTTSVGSAAIERFARPVCFQDVPEALLPDELKSANPRGIWRMVDGRFTKDVM